MDQETEMENLTSHHPRVDLNRSSWYTNETDNSFAQSTIHSQEDAAINLKPPSLVQRQSFHKSDPNQEAHNQNDISPESSSSHAIPNSSQAPVVSEDPKPSLFTRLRSSLPLFAQFRKTAKAATALLISVVFIFSFHTREAIGSSVLLVAIVTIFFFPVRTIGNVDLYGL